MSYLTKAVTVLRTEGVSGLITKGLPFIYNRHIAPLLPKEIAVYNGTNINANQSSHLVFPFRVADRPSYESGLISSLEAHVTEGDHTVIVGGGWGVTAVKAAQSAGDSGSVTVYEGSASEIEKIKWTVQLNTVPDVISVHHNIVGSLVSLRGNAGDPTQLSPTELPECDVLELDCEGSEIHILKNMDIRPRVIIVESHGMYDVPPTKIKSLLNELSYTVVSEEIADEGERNHCVENDIFVLTAVRE